MMTLCILLSSQTFCCRRDADHFAPSMALASLWPKPFRFKFSVSQLRIDRCATFCGRYGCKLSQKMFVGKEYVLKHVRNKHTAVMEAMQEEVLHSLSLIPPQIVNVIS